MNYATSRLRPALVVILGFGSCLHGQDAQPPVEAPTVQGQTTLTPAERLAACKRLYESLRTYQDKGEVTTEIDADGMKSTSTPFSTAFERDGRFRWEFVGSVTPGRKADKRYVVWSSDQKTFESWWQVMPGRKRFDSIGMAMAGPTGVSGGSATAIVPLLRMDAEYSSRTTDLRGAVEKGEEEVDGVMCRVIEGKGATDLPGVTGFVIKLWLDGSMAIRRIEETKVIDPTAMLGDRAAPGTPDRLRVHTTINIHPTLNQPIPDGAFDPRLPPP